MTGAPPDGIHKVSAPFLNDNTTTLLTTTDPLAGGSGTEVTNPFVVTEAHDLHPESWALTALSFTRRLTP